MVTSNDAHFRLRLPPTLKRAIERSAAANGRSITSEVVRRLEKTFVEDSVAPGAGSPEKPSLELLSLKREVISILLDLARDEVFRLGCLPPKAGTKLAPDDLSRMRVELLKGHLEDTLANYAALLAE